MVGEDLAERSSWIGDRVGAMDAERFFSSACTRRSTVYPERLRSGRGGADVFEAVGKRTEAAGSRASVLVAVTDGAETNPPVGACAATAANVSMEA